MKGLSISGNLLSWKLAKEKPSPIFVKSFIGVSKGGFVFSGLRCFIECQVKYLCIALRTKRICITSDHEKCDGKSKSSRTYLEERKMLIDVGLVEDALMKILSLRRSIASMEFYRFYSSSLLIIYEGDTVLSTKDFKAPKGSHSKIKLGLMENGDNISSKSCAPTPTTQSFPKKSSPKISPVLSTKCKYSPHTSKDPSHVTRIRKSDGPKNELKHSKKVHDTDCKRYSHGDQKELPASKDDVNGVEVRLIDFAHFCSRDQVVHPGADGGFLYGLDQLSALLRSMIC